LNMASVGILRTPNCEAMPGWSSVLSLPSLTSGSSSAAARSNDGAITLQGPHHGAQKSTTTGMSLFWVWAVKFALLSSIGWPVNTLFLHRPHFGASAALSRGSRLVVSQWGHTTWTILLFIT